MVFILLNTSLISLGRAYLHDKNGVILSDYFKEDIYSSWSSWSA